MLGSRFDTVGAPFGIPSLGPVWQTILRWQACFLFKKNLRQELSFLRPAQDLHTFFDYLFVLILGVLVFAPAAATPPGSSLGELSGVALLGRFVSASSILVIRVVNLIDVGQGYMITKRSSQRAQGLLK